MALRPRVLVIDDEPQIHRFLGPALTADGFDPVRALTGAEGLAELARRPIPEAVILDLGLPDMDGQAVLIQARRFYSSAILILSARDRETEKVMALDNGADDYVEKPFSVGELLARLRSAIRANLRLAGAEAIVRAGDLEIDLVKRRVFRSGELVRLSTREYDLLAEIVKGGGRVLTHGHLLTKIWGPAHINDVQYLRSYILQLRHKIEADASNPIYLKTVAGVGYHFNS